VPKGTLGILFAGLNCYHVPLPQGINEASGRSGAANITEKQVQVSIGPRSHSPCMRFENCVSQVTLPYRLLPPRSGLERSDFVPWHKADLTVALVNVRCWMIVWTARFKNATTDLTQANAGQEIALHPAIPGACAGNSGAGQA